MGQKRKRRKRRKKRKKNEPAAPREKQQRQAPGQPQPWGRAEMERDLIGLNKRYRCIQQRK
jgi:hypothetical protein